MNVRAAPPAASARAGGEARPMLSKIGQGACGRAQLAGFTLIELLVVIAIIGLLSSVVLASLSSARARAEDTSRMAAVQQMERALELFYSDHGRYPNNSDAYYYALTSYQGGECGYLNGWCDLETTLEPYMSALPRDSSTERRFVYKGVPSGTMYGLLVVVDEPNAAAESDGGYHDSWYEVGSLPKYCMEKYADAEANWNYWSYSSMCAGGN